MHGKNFIGNELSALGNSSFFGENPINGETLSQAYTEATSEEVSKACELATEAFKSYKLKSGKEKAAFINCIADQIMAIGDELLEVCHAETGLPMPRLQGERGRTCNQLKMFANLVQEGSWVNARIDTAQPERSPLPKSDLRYMEKAIGPVAVFGASNFPLAFSTAGGDTASALAAGCPVVVKAHPAHPGTAELVAKAISAAVKEYDMPEGTFSMVHGRGADTGLALVTNTNIKAVGFTGSLAAGRAIFNACSARPEPIPVYAEMGSSNPVFLLPEALKSRSEAVAQGLSESVCLGAGQFCTNPGMLVALESAETDTFISQLGDGLSVQSAGTTVHHTIKSGYDAKVDKKLVIDGVKLISRSSASSENEATAVQPLLMKTTASAFISNSSLADEVFGPSTMIVVCKDKEELFLLAAKLEGQLTGSLQAEDTDLEEFSSLVDILEDKCGRLIINEYPTGVEVCPSMMHGGPYPASTDSRTTSVGTSAIHRYTKPVSYQNFPNSLLPKELKEENPLEIIRLVDGEYTR